MTENRTWPALVYFIQAGDSTGPIKIGFSRHDRLAWRFRDLQCGNHLPLTVLGTVPGDRATEGQMHMLFADQRLRGEWFSSSPDMLGFIHDVADPAPA